MSSVQYMEFDSRYLPAACISFLFFLFLFKFASPKLSKKIFAKYNDLPEASRIDWDTRHNSPTVRTECAVVMGYMLADAVMMTIYYKQIGEVFFYFHHAASIYAYYYVVVYGVMTGFANYRLLAEISTPFVNNRYFFDVLGIKKTDPLGFTNGILMTLSFFAVRILVMPIYWMKVYQVYGTEAFLRTGHVQMVLLVTCVVLDIINLFWFYKMLKGVHKVLREWKSTYSKWQPTKDGGKAPRDSSTRTTTWYCNSPYNCNGSQRMVQDKTYYLGLIRGKLNDLNAENARLKKEIENSSEENSSFLTYEKRAESLASEIRDLQGELGDYNTLVDKLTTDEDIQDVEFDLNDLRANNEREAKKIEDLFEVKKEKEDRIRQLETELDQEKRMADNLVNDMDPDMRQKYFALKDMNEHMLRQLEKSQQELDVLNSKIGNLQEELSMSQVKQEAVRLYDQINDLEIQRDNYLEETRNKQSPAEERERLLKQVKEDNQEIASLERQTNELKEKIENIEEEIRQLDLDIEENQGERNQKYKELKKREETIDEFLNNFEESKGQEMEKLKQTEQNIVSLLEHTSRNMSRFTALPTPQELGTMKEDLEFKTGEMKKSEQTTVGLAAESDKLQSDLQKVEQLEEKINTELVMLKEKTATMEKELEIYSDLSSLKEEAEKKRRKLMDDRVSLQRRRDTFKKTMQQLTIINTKTMECDYRAISKRVSSVISDFNTILQKQMAGKTSM
uniref:Intraflagellar transport protein 74-like protein n=1 Tax=Magallana gigas TaxID=29159 RepID=K1QDK8_MAGGI